MSKDRTPSGKPATPDQIDFINERINRQIHDMNFISREAVNAYMDTHFKGVHFDEVITKTSRKGSKRDQADELIYKAYELDAKEASELIRQALQIDKDNVRALILLGQHLQDPEDAEDVFAEAANLARLELDPALFQEKIDEFWYVPQARLYLKATLFAGQCLLDMGDYKSAIIYLEHILLLDPQDHMDVRFDLLNCYFIRKKLGLAKKILDRISDDNSTLYLFTCLLFGILKKWEKPKLDILFERAKNANPHLISLLTHEKRPDNRFEDAEFEPGSIGEAHNYYQSTGGDAWQHHQEAIGWLIYRHRFEGKAPRTRKRKPDSGT